MIIFLQKILLLSSTLMINPNSYLYSQQAHKLQYLYYSNGGLIGFFDDGTVAGCPRCELLPENVDYLLTADPYTTYLKIDGCLIINASESFCPEYPDPTCSDCKPDVWAVIDFKWLVNIE